MLSTTSRPKTITVIIAMLLLLAVVSTVSILTSRIGFGTGGNLRTGSGLGRTVQGTPGARSGQGSNGNLQGTPGANTRQGNASNFQNRAAAGGFNFLSIFRMLGLNGQVIGIFNIALPIVGIALLLASAYGVWKGKRWALNLATLLGVLFLVGALPGFFSIGGRNINWLRTGLNALSAVATLPILAVSFLPSVRDYFPKPASKPKAR